MPRPKRDRGPNWLIVPRQLGSGGNPLPALASSRRYAAAWGRGGRHIRLDPRRSCFVCGRRAATPTRQPSPMAPPKNSPSPCPDPQHSPATPPCTYLHLRERRMLLEVAGRRSEAGPRAASLPSFCPRAIDASFTGAQQDEVHRLCGWLLGERDRRQKRCLVRLLADSSSQTPHTPVGARWRVVPAAAPACVESRLRPLAALLQGPTAGEVDVGRLHPWPTLFLNAPSTADGDDGAPLQASKSPSSLQPALSIAAAPPSNQRSPPAAQPQMPFSVAAPNAGPTHVSPFGAAATPAPLFAAPQSASSGPASPPRTGDRALSWVAMWCARAEAEGMQCLPPPSSPSWQQLVASGSLGGALGQR